MALNEHDRTEIMVDYEFGPAMALASLYLIASLPAAVVVGNDPDQSPGLVWAISVALALMLIALSAIDARSYLLPDFLTLPLACAGLALQVASGWERLAIHAGAAVAAYAFMSIVAVGYHIARGRAGLGGGDAKLFAAAGAWLGIVALPSVLLFATGAALVSVAVAMVRNGTAEMDHAIPFGPYLAFAIWLVWLYGPIAVPG